MRVAFTNNRATVMKVNAKCTLVEQINVWLGRVRCWIKNHKATVMKVNAKCTLVEQINVWLGRVRCWIKNHKLDLALEKDHHTGIRKCGMGGAIGLGLSALYAVWNSREKLAELTQFNPAQR
ncbi:hypothetical protein QE152_g18957 [Popillia japonica]|uniref:Uncharacterized protein n=1 Tax=Popillia japonica TaxID=7064 RepID=A0AAW1L506_POPJA